MTRESPVRFGGARRDGRWVFELTGGRACLDLANTLDERETDHPRERLRSYDDLLDWGTQAGTVDAAKAAVLRERARRRPRAGESAAVRARALREAIFAVFAAVAARRRPPASALASLNGALARMAGMRRLEASGRGFTWRWETASDDLERVVWPAAWSAAELLTSPEVDRVRLCAGAGCAWLFIDTSKNRTRRWCDMSVCGNRAKARRHYAKTSSQ